MLACVQLDLTEDWCWLAVHVDAVGMYHGCVGVRMLMRGVVRGGNGGDGAMCGIVVDDNTGDAAVSAALCWLLAAVGKSADSACCVACIAWRWTMMLFL